MIFANYNNYSNAKVGTLNKIWYWKNTKLKKSKKNPEISKNVSIKQFAPNKYLKEYICCCCSQ